MESLGFLDIDGVVMAQAFSSSVFVSSITDALKQLFPVK
jgi:hypothetical protein